MGESRVEVTGIIMGQGAPNECRDGSKTKCAIILNDDLGFFRVYPILAERSFPVWGRVRCEITRNEKDTRSESYKIAPDFEIMGRIDRPEEKRAILNECCLKSGDHDPLDYQNQNRRSIALIKQGYGTMSATLEQRNRISPDDPEFGGIMTKDDHWNKPLLRWKSFQGKQHESHLVGTEVYEGLRKNPENPFNIFNNLQICNPDFETWLLLGNMRDRRTIWVVVH